MLETLKKYFGYSSFRPLQEEIISHVLSGQDSFVLMPTGGGKSLCYQLPALKFSGITLVISPLIALMKDQVDALRSNGIAAEFINSSLTATEISNIQKKARAGETKILYLAPERLALFNFQKFLKTLDISLIAIDEAHCISEWGHDFRPDYRNLATLKNMFSGIPLMALTATATEKVRQDITRQLNINSARVFISSFNRPNLSYVVRPKRNTFSSLVSMLKKYQNRSVIIYCFSRKETEKLALDLRYEGFQALAYHAGLSSDVRKETQEKFVRDEIQIIVATIAFGMGIDKPDVRLVVHYSLPKSIEGYYQETGRAGRDGINSECVLFYSYGDTMKHEFFFRDIQDENERRNAERKLAEIVNYAELKTCRREFLLSYFGEKQETSSCENCDICLTPQEEIDATVITQKILSAVIKTGARFGSRHIISVLRGSKVKRVLELKHDKLSVFGIARDLSEEEIQHFISLLVNKRFLKKDAGKYPTLSLSNRAKIFLNSREKIFLPKPSFEQEVAGGEERNVLEYEKELFEELRTLRKKIADEKNVPPFVIFSDVALQEMAYYLPQNSESFLRISGVGNAKLEEYGGKFMKVIGDYAKKNNLSERDNLSSKIVTRDKSAAPRLKREDSTYIRTKQMIEAGMTIEKVAALRNLSLATILSHLEKLIGNGEEIEINHLRLPEDRFQKIERAFQKAGTTFLAPVKELLGEDYSYEELRLARLFL